MFATNTRVIYENVIAGQTYSLPFDWLDNSQILVYGDSEKLTETLQYTLDKTARTIVPLSNYEKLVVTRYTLGSNLAYDFKNTKSLQADELQRALDIIRQLAEEGYTLDQTKCGETPGTLRHGTLDQWLATNPVLALGELGFISDTNELVVGDGVTSFSDLKRFLNQSQVATTVVNGYMSAADKQFLNLHNLGNNRLLVDGSIDQIKLRYATLTEWTNANPVLAKGELGIIIDANTIVIGDGITSFNNLIPLVSYFVGFSWYFTVPSTQLLNVS